MLLAHGVLMHSLTAAHNNPIRLGLQLHLTSILLVQTKPVPMDFGSAVLALKKYCFQCKTIATSGMEQITRANEIQNAAAVALVESRHF